MAFNLSALTNYEHDGYHSSEESTETCYDYGTPSLLLNFYYYIHSTLLLVLSTTHMKRQGLYHTNEEGSMEDIPVSRSEGSFSDNVHLCVYKYLSNNDRQEKYNTILFDS